MYNSKSVLKKLVQEDGAKVELLETAQDVQWEVTSNIVRLHPKRSDLQLFQDIITVLATPELAEVIRYACVWNRYAHAPKSPYLGAQWV